MAKDIKIYKERRLYYFECRQCGRKKSASFKRKRAREKVCKKCRNKNAKINPNQQVLFGEKEKLNAGQI